MRALIALLLFVLPAPGGLAHAEIINCEGDGHNGQMYVDITTSWVGKTSIHMRLGANTNVEYVVTEANSTHYRGYAKNDRNMTFYMDRITGKLTTLLYAEKSSLGPLVELCDKKITPDQCAEKIPNTEGLHCLLSEPTLAQCQRWRSGHQLVNEHTYMCKAAAQKF